MSLLNVGVSSLVANQQALQTTGHNIANANTAGYSRQTVSYNAQVGQNLGSGFIGNGVQVATVLRNFDTLLGKQSNAAKATSAADSARYQALNQMQDVFTGGDSGLGQAINDMLNAFADVQTAPSDATARNVALTRMSELTARLRSANATLDELDYTTRQQIDNNVNVVNSLATQVATLNGQISRSLATGHAPNDLLDARDEVVRQINQYVQTSQVSADDGSISLFVGGSQPLVLGASSAQLSARESSQYPGSQKLSLYFSQPGGESVELTVAMLGGGAVAGLLKFNNDDLVEGRNLLGRLSLAIGNELNQQNQLGLTLSGNQGTALFQLTTSTQGYSQIAGYSLASAGSYASAEVVDSRSLAASDYQIVFASGSAKLVRMSDGTTTAISPQADGSLDLTVDGLRFQVPASVAAAAQTNQSILFQPYRQAASEISAIQHNPDELAVASAVSAQISPTNAGTLQLASLGATSLSANGGLNVPAVDAPVQLRFDGNGGYSLYRYDRASANWVADSQAGRYTSGQTISVDGWSITLTGTPAAGDTVTVQNSRDSALGDAWTRNAGNASAFLALRDATVFDRGTTLSDGFSAAMAVVGTRTQSAEYAAQLSSTVATNLEADRTAVSGVSLDEEAARLLQYQQAYQASAKIIQTAQSLFDSVLNAVGR